MSPEATPFRRYRCKCSTCGGFGDVCFEQVTKRGTRVLVVYRCSCPAGMVNYSNLPPVPPMAPHVPYLGQPEYEDD